MTSAVPWMNNLSFQPIPGLGNLNSGFYNDLRKGSLVSERGPTLTNTRAAPTFPTTTVDFEGLVKNIQANEARFRGLRRVEQLLLAPENLNGSGWTKQAGATVTQISGSEWEVDISACANGSGVFVTSNGTLPVGGTARASFSVKVMSASGDNALQIKEPAGSAFSNFDITLTTAWQRFASPNFTVAQANNGFWLAKKAAGATLFRFRQPQVENTTGQAITAPSRYISNGVLAAPYHGAGVDGVSYTDADGVPRTNGNTVSSNVVTEAAGTPLTLTAAGIAPYGAHKNCVIQSEDWATTWTAVGTPTRVAGSQTCGVVSLDTIGDDSAVALEGYTETVTFTGNSTKSVLAFIKKGTATSSVVRLRDTTAAANRLLAAITWTGSVPTVTMTTGTLVESQALADGVYRINMSATTVTAANTNSLEFYPATDAALDITQTGTIIWGGVMATDAVIGTVPYVKTTTAAVSVAADVVTATYAGGTEGGLFVQAVGPVDAVTGNHILFGIDDGTGNEVIVLQQGAVANQLRLSIVDGGAVVGTPNAGTFVAGAVGKAAGRYKLNDSNAAFNGSAGTADTSCTMPTTTTIRLGFASAGAEANTTIQVVAAGPTPPSDAGLATATSP